MKILVLALLLFSQELFAKEGSQTKSFSLLDDLSSPFTTDAKYITLGGLSAATIVYFNKSTRTYRKRESFKDAQPFGDYGFIGETVGWGFLNVIYTVSAYTYGKYYNDIESLKAAEHMAKASFYSLGVTMTLKKLINEKRPGYPDDPDSFPSGHSSASFAFASVVAARHGWYWGGLAYTTAAFVSLSRINDDFHYLHDVLFGMTIGASYGWGLYHQYENGSPYFLTVLPTPKGVGATFAMEF